MRVRILGCSGGIGAALRTTSILVDDDLLIDSGTGVGDLSLSEMRRIRRLLLTHSHLDHTAALPLLVDTMFENLEGRPLQVHAQAVTIKALRDHLFNWVTWPDFTELPDASNPVLEFVEFEADSERVIDGRKVRSITVKHTVPAVAFVVESADGRIFAFSGDTAANDGLWEALNALPRIDLLVVETAFSNANAELAVMAKHYSPESLEADLAKLKHKTPVHITHLKPGGEDLIMEQIKDIVTDREVHRLEGGEVFEI